jgi:hypothetical protein
MGEKGYNMSRYRVNAVKCIAVYTTFGITVHIQKHEYYSLIKK